MIVEANKLPRSLWKVGIVEELFQGKDEKIRGAAVGIPKTNSVIKRPINKLYLVERMGDNTETHDDSSYVTKDIVNTSRPRREAAIIGEIKRKFDT